MAQYELISSVSRSIQYPVSTAVSAPSNCGTLIVMITTPFSYQMLCELPTINVKIYTGTNDILYNFDVNLTTVNNDITPSGSVEPYSVPIYDLPATFKMSVSPMFDKYAISAHNATVECGIVDSLQTTNGIVSQDTSSFKWTSETATFPIGVYFDNTNIQSGNNSGGGGGGGGGSSSAVDVSYNNSLSGLTSTNVQDAITELAGMATTINTYTKTVTLSAANWSTNNYTINDSDIKADSDIYLNVPSNVTQQQYDALAYANIVPVSQTAGNVYIKALGTVPTIDIPIEMVIRNID